MKPLQENPELFVNGEFKFMDSWECVNILVGVTNHGYELIGYGEGDYAEEKDTYDPVDCTLIARKIEDITDKELSEAREYSHKQVSRRLIDLYQKQDSIPNKLFIYLLSIGVYPFDQDHFGDTVIDTRTLTNA